ncbi:hypothetical protein ACFSB1_12570 [Halopseudomonas phragmitis]|uniref:Uncharacterized protein n=1 Tax=Halopseudomonas phragmitis TaxID=1931241 RepID=A0A1V0B0M1_9GAMM|nr:hypothetical protein [Halopseudomonas phragmitis]AQZ93482.1 hypothetical protein BVH74_01290 [Halopseudomonas phragmitis]
MTDMDFSTVYGPQAYDSTHIPDQPPQVRRHTGALSQRLPWGYTQEILPIGFIGGFDPKSLREEDERERQEPGYRARLAETLNAVFDHQRYRYTPLQGWTQLFIYMHGLGKWSFIVILATFIIGFPVVAFALRDSSLYDVFITVLELGFWVLTPCLVSWLIGYLVLKYVPERYLLKPSRKGPVWEMNRQTGLVTIFARKPGQFRKLGIEGDFVAPFYEFDAAIHTIPDRQGFPLHMLNLVHRYQVAAIDFSVLMGKVGIQTHCMALWDFWQQYMDISKPLPEVPDLEPFRHLDPTTAEHDQRTGRPARYWRDMDEQTYKRRIQEISDISKVNMDRLNIMVRHVRYMH